MPTSFDTDGVVEEEPFGKERGPAPGRRPARIAVIGGGFSGVLTAIHLLWRCQPGERIYLIEKNGRLGQGLAFGTRHPQHVLNVRAENMSAFADEPAHFARWLARQEGDEAVGVVSPAGIFARRELYGRYIQGLLADAIVRQGGAANFYLIDDEAVGLRAEDGGWSLETGCGRSYEMDAVVLAIGNFPPDSQNRPGYMADPWGRETLAGIGADEPILLLGTGLTMVDLCLALRAEGYRGQITAISRNGRLPHAHAPSAAWQGLKLEAGDRGSLTRLVRAIRRNVRMAEAEGVGWRGVMDALRPHIATLWQEMTEVDRRRFLRHVRSIWDIHRHRMAPSHAAALQSEIDQGTLRVLAGRVRGIEAEADGAGARVSYAPKGMQTPVQASFARVINCAGLGTDVNRLRSPLIKSLLSQGFATSDPLRLGLATSAAGALIDKEGRLQRRLYAVGPITRGTFWEITSVPDIRAQAEQVALTALTAARQVKG
ncbi:Uncharacterized NAD(P)/FAD-binding protein YdhS [Arboricoccus pini]|uniref:Uncharacterized NAD(P)/FAD-binding protein YdhS n=1 Tax=Arboricoccus pini TaxID=1963835 RepID=A0A212RZU9_9PROT|nr:FAD/NAD(P)-binding protein [Arboricoccus pini]SNB78378.1 Uncharacterized NAD(P)/FAD-binding protein YdhS [Arboricoccus pini]